MTDDLDLPAQLAALWERVNTIQPSALRVARAPIPLLAGTTTTADLPITWDTPMPTATYSIQTTPDLALLGKLTVTVKAQTREGCVLTVKATATVAVGSSVLAIAHT